MLWRLLSRDTDAGRERAIGVLLSKFLGETFMAIAESRRMHVRLGGGQRRWGEKGSPHTRYVFTILADEQIPAED
jgi:hypothetical protein